MSNRLAGETSPYLQQHAGNPVDWYAWGEEALARARTEDKPAERTVNAWLCRGVTCLPPIDDVRVLVKACKEAAS